MEIIFESDIADFAIEFESDFLSENFSDRTDVQWKFQDGTHTRVVANVLNVPPNRRDSSTHLLPFVRLCG
tara:strand:+ start:309 stop:518 length:210 start_codon:yes stop_codon:yes gene_type:complete